MNEGLRWIGAKLFVFTVVTIIVTVWLASVIGNFRLTSSPYEVTAEFSDATGLLRGDAVKAAGVTVGRVDEMRLRDGIAVVTLAIDEGIEIPADVSAVVRFRNLVGQRMIVFEEPRGSDVSSVLAHGDRIPLERTEPAFDLTALFNGLRPLIRSTDPGDINAVAEAVTTALTGRGDEVESILGNLAAVSDTLASRDQELSAMLEGLEILTTDIADRDAQLQRTLGNMDTFLADLSASREDLSQALVTLDDAAARFGRILDRNDSLIEGELADLATILDAVNEKRRALRGALRALPGMLEGVERVNSYGQWTMIHLVDACKDDLRECGDRRLP